MNHWRQYPFARILLPFGAGIVLCDTLHLPVWIFILLAAFAIGLYLLAHSFQKIPVKQVPVYKGISIFMLFLVFGFFTTLFSKDHSATNYFTQVKGDYTEIRVSSLPEIKRKSVRIEAEIVAKGNPGGMQTASGNALLYLEPRPDETINYGDHLLLASHIFKPVPPPLNPLEFDYRQYLHYDNIHLQGYVYNQAWLKLQKNSSIWLFRFSYFLQQYLHGIYIKYLPDKQNRGIIEAIVFGYKNDLDRDIISAYSKTGIIHVLAVSGLHVGIIYFVLGLLTAGLNNTLRRKQVRVVIIIGFLFIYALLTGFAPSVCRAVLMFSFFIFSEGIRRDTNIYNVLCASATVLLVISPLWLFNVGFQLSYIAVFGIVYIQNYIKRWIPVTDWFLDKAWTLLAVSVSAQIVTFPLCLYYFHQYPNLFFISNLVVIPLIFMVLSLAGIMPFIQLIPWVNELNKPLAKLIDIYLYFINDLVLSIQNLPYAFFDNLYVNFNEMLLIYLLVFALLFWLIYKLPRMAVVSLMAAGLLVWSISLRKSHNSQTNAWVSFAIKNHPNIGLKNGRDLTLYTDSAVYHNPSITEYHCLPWFLQNCGGIFTIKPLDSIVTGDLTLLTINDNKLYLAKKLWLKQLGNLPSESNVYSLKGLWKKPLGHLNFVSAGGNPQLSGFYNTSQTGFWYLPIK